MTKVAQWISNSELPLTLSKAVKNLQCTHNLGEANLSVYSHLFKKQNMIVIMRCHHKVTSCETMIWETNYFGIFGRSSLGLALGARGQKIFNHQYLNSEKLHYVI